jgi:hypothetical protein
MDSHQKKRSSSDDPNAHVAKRARLEEDSPGPIDGNHNADYSVESLLSVPLSVIFRHVPNSAHPRPLLTRAEAQCFLQVNLLAHEFDVLVQLSEQTLGRQRWCRIFLRGELLKYSNTNPYLRPLCTMLTLHQQQQQQTCPRVVASALDRMLQSLAGCATTLRQSSEQNWTLSESLLDALEGAIGGGGQVLAQEKKRLAELEEEVCSRVERLLETHQTTQHRKSNEEDGIVLVVEPTLRAVCKSIWGGDLNLNSREESSSLPTLTNNSDNKEASEAGGAPTTTTATTTTKEDNMPLPPPQESTTHPAPKYTMPRPPSHESTKDPIPPSLAAPSSHEASFFSYPTQNSLPAKAQPEYRKDDDDEEEREDSDDELIPDPHQESQNSFLKRSSAAEALTVLAIGRPASK